MVGRKKKSKVVEKQDANIPWSAVDTLELVEEKAEVSDHVEPDFKYVQQEIADPMDNQVLISDNGGELPVTQKVKARYVFRHWQHVATNGDRLIQMLTIFIKRMQQKGVITLNERHKGFLDAPMNAKDKLKYIYAIIKEQFEASDYSIVRNDFVSSMPDIHKTLVQAERIPNTVKCRLKFKTHLNNQLINRLAMFEQMAILLIVLNKEHGVVRFKNIIGENQPLEVMFLTQKTTTTDKQNYILQLLPMIWNQMDVLNMFFEEEIKELVDENIFYDYLHAK